MHATADTKHHISRLRSHRLRSGLSPQELAYLVGFQSPGAISRVEKRMRRPSVNLLVACFVIFGTGVTDIFPGTLNGVETGVMARVWSLYESIQGAPSRKTKAKIELLESAIDRAKQRS